MHPLSSTEILSELVGFETVSHRSNLALIDWVANYLSDLGIRCHFTRNDDGTKANLFATAGPADQGGICLHGHTDVVPVDGQPWTTDPFQLVAKDGRLYGRGTTDMKAWLACSLAAAPAFAARRLRTPIHLALSYDEEIGCFGAPRMLESFGSSVPKPLAAFIGEPSMMSPITAHKGCLALETRITGRDVHSSLLHLGVSAATAAAEMTLELAGICREWIDRPGPVGMIPSGPTVSVGRLAAGVARNIVPREASLLWEIRYRKGDGPDDLLEETLRRTRLRLRDAFGADFEAIGIQTHELARVPPFEAAPGSLAEQLARQFGAEGFAQAVPYGAEAGQYADAGISAVICGPGSIAQAHQPDEFIAMEQVDACDRFLARLGEWAQSFYLHREVSPRNADVVSKE